MTFVDSCALLSSRLFLTFFKKSKFLCIRRAQIHMDMNKEGKSSKEVVNLPHIVATYRQALETFDDKFKIKLQANLSKLKTLVDKIRPEDLGLDRSIVLDPEYWKKPHKAPCTYIEVFQNDQVNMSIFILKPGFKMPMHDHPHMNGFLKVICGAVRIRSFSEYPLNDVNKEDFVARLKLETARIAQHIHKKRRLFAQVSTDKIFTDRAETCTLTPTVSNYHEIEALDMPAAFFDVLAPPYDTLIEGIGPRRCRYYTVANEISTNVVELEEIEVPKCFFCDQLPYLGPKLN